MYLIKYKDKNNNHIIRSEMTTTTTKRKIRGGSFVTLSLTTKESTSSLILKMIHHIHGVL